jgi:hypothetical protein
MCDKVNGRRVMPGPDGYLDPAEINKPACYGRATSSRVVGSRAGWWEVTCPDGSIGSLNPDIHAVEEHDDGTITVTPSIDMSKRKPGAWHGWLRRGVFESV